MQFQRGSIGLFFRGDPTLKGWFGFYNNSPKDFTGQGFNGTISTVGSGSYFYNPDRTPLLSLNGNALSMRGATGSSSNYVLVRWTTSDVFNIVAPLTLMVWYRNVDNKCNHLLSRTRTFTSAPWYHFSFYGGVNYGNGIQLSFLYYSGGALVYNNSTITSAVPIDGKYHLLTVTKDLQYVKFYVDNKLLEAISSTSHTWD